MKTKEKLVSAISSTKLNEKEDSMYRHAYIYIASLFLLIAIPVSLGRILHRYVNPHMSITADVVWPDVLIVAIVILLMLNDWRKQKVYFAYWFSLVFFLIQIATVHLFLTWHPWVAFCKWLAG